MKRRIGSLGVAICLLLWVSAACSQTLTQEQKLTLAGLKDDLSKAQKEVEQATQDDAKYSGGLIKSLIGVRLEVLRINVELIEQRIHALEGGADESIVVNISKADQARAEELLAEIEGQQKKVAEARREADRYSGGLVKALSESTVATAAYTLAMLEQQYFVAKYGLAVPQLPAAVASETAAQTQRATSSPTPGTIMASGCLKIETFDSSVLSSNDVYTELAWKADVVNTCAEGFGVRVNFTIYDKDEFELDSDNEDVFVPANGTGKARGKMLVSPPEKARRMARQGASLSIR